jgi:hypothetical protein
LLLTEAVANRLLGPWPPQRAPEVFSASFHKNKEGVMESILMSEPEPAAVVAAELDY